MLCPRPGQRPLRPFHSVVVIFIKNRRLNLQVQHPESNMRRRLQKKHIDSVTTGEFPCGVQ